ncbi:DoxX family membrane protein [Hymenobacter psoromatis]|uniref:DoxX family membrane protein n=1 Tax=Hymenobacter psoromatis TaxID=1484116 RepID=UPI001CBEDEAC|nr:DoxX family membrane protein [Hymenobacter psoromatis]
MTISSFTKAHYWDYFILMARVALAFIFMSYGLAKLAGYQFGVTSEILAQPLGQVSLAHVAWYCFGHEPFSAFVGISQVLASLLLLWNRTALVGAVLLLPIAITIFIIDLTYLNEIVAFRYALPFYLGLIFLIINHYRSRMVVVFRALALGVTTRFSYPLWTYFMLPVAGILLSMSWLLPKYTVDFIHNPAGTIRYFELLFTHLKQLIS